MGKVVLVNDTSEWYHWGCTCTSTALRGLIASAGHSVVSVPIQQIYRLEPAPEDPNQLVDGAFHRQFAARNAALVETLAAADVVVINGEGSLHGFTRPVMNLFFLALFAKFHVGRPVHLVNHSCFPADGRVPETATGVEGLYKAVYSRLDFVAVRDTISAQVLLRLGIQATQSFDCLPLYVREHRDEVQTEAAAADVLLSGSATLEEQLPEEFFSFIRSLLDGGHSPAFLMGAKSAPNPEDQTLAKQLTSRFGADIRIVNTETPAEWLNTIAAAKVFVSGRFHHSLAAACVGTPFVMLGSNTLKMVALAAMLNVEIPVEWDDPALQSTLADRVRSVLEAPARTAISPEKRAEVEALAEHNVDGLR